MRHQQPPYVWQSLAGTTPPADRKRSNSVARLPSGDYLIQSLADGDVFVFQDHTERQIARFNPNDRDQLVNGLAAISASDLSGEDKSFAHFWSGYFYAHAAHGEPIL